MGEGGCVLMKRPGRVAHLGLRASRAQSVFPAIVVAQAGDVSDKFVGVLDGPGSPFQAFAQFPAPQRRIGRFGGASACGVRNSDFFCHNAVVIGRLQGTMFGAASPRYLSVSQAFERSVAACGSGTLSQRKDST